MLKLRLFFHFLGEENIENLLQVVVICNLINYNMEKKSLHRGATLLLLLMCSVVLELLQKKNIIPILFSKTTFY